MKKNKDDLLDDIEGFVDSDWKEVYENFKQEEYRKEIQEATIPDYPYYRDFYKALIEIAGYNDISHLSFKENQFDVVMSFHVLTFVPEHARPLVLQEVRRVLRPHGIFVAVERSQKDPDYKKGVEIERETYTFQGYTHHFFSGEELRELLSPMDVAVLRDMRIIDASHGSLHVHGVWTAVAVNK